MSGELRARHMEGERWKMEARLADPPSTLEGECWIRPDLAPEPDQLGTLRVDVGNSTLDVPIFAGGTSSADIEESLRIQLNNDVGYVPLAPLQDATYPELRVQQSSGTYGMHDAVEVSAIPDSDLTQYSLTDPDGRISVVGSESYEARMPNGTNEVARLYTAETLSDYSRILLSFSFEILSYSTSAQLPMMAWTDTEDAVYSDTNRFVGMDIGSNGSTTPSVNPRTKSDSDTGNGSAARLRTVGLDLNTIYDVEMDFDLSTDDLTVTVFESGSQIGSDTVTIPSGSYEWLYAAQSLDGGFSAEGEIDIDVSNYSFEAL